VLCYNIKNTKSREKGSAMKVKLVFEEPIVVAYGAEHKGLGWSEWGPTQFPSLHRGENDVLICAYGNSEDTTDAWGRIRIHCVSEDGGDTWRQIKLDSEEFNCIRAQTGVKLPNGEYLRVEKPAIEEISEELYEQLKSMRTPGYSTLLASKLPQDLQIKGMPCYRSEKGGRNEKPYLCGWDFSAQCVGFPPTEIHTWLKKGVIKYFAYSKDSLKVDAKGRIWFATDSCSCNPETMEESKFNNVYVFCSDDNGASFQLKSFIMCDGKVQEFNGVIGYYEPEICFMPDESIIMLIRTGSTTPSLFSRSTDDGKTWSKPVIFDRCGIRPGLVHLENGVTLAIYGRPGMYLRATADPSGVDWDEPFELMPYEYDPNDIEKLFTKSCFNSRIIAIDDNTAMIAYSDFFTKDEQGVNRKAIKVRKVHTEIVE